jgi:hypothetical protein
MKLTSCLNQLGIGALVFSTAIALQQPADANTSNAGVTVVPAVPIIIPSTVPPAAIVIAPPPIVTNSFFCGRGANGIPTTFVNTLSGNTPMVRWVSEFFQDSGYTPEVRCRDVSQRFNSFYNQGILNFLTTGIVNRQPVICVASVMGGPCTGVLFTLRPGQNATRVIQQLFDVRAGASGPLLESEERIYIDMTPYTSAIQGNQANR